MRQHDQKVTFESGPLQIKIRKLIKIKDLLIYILMD